MTSRDDIQRPLGDSVILTRIRNAPVGGRLRVLHRWIRASTAYRWAAGDANRDVVVINLAETRTFGPLIRVLDVMIARRFGHLRPIQHPGGPAGYVVSAVIAALCAALVAGIIFDRTGRMRGIARMYDLEGVSIAWAIHGVHSTVAGIVLGVVIGLLLTREHGAIARLHDAIGGVLTGGVIGTALGLMLWLTVVVILLPWWLGTVVGLERPLPYIHVPSLIALVVFGLTIGIIVPIVGATISILKQAKAGSIG